MVLQKKRGVTVFQQTYPILKDFLIEQGFEDFFFLFSLIPKKNSFLFFFLKKKLQARVIKQL